MFLIRKKMQEMPLCLQCSCRELLPTLWCLCKCLHVQQKLWVTERYLLKKLCVRKKMEHCAPEEEERRASFEPAAVRFLCIFMWRDEWEFPLPPLYYGSPELQQTCSSGWRKVEFVDFKTRIWKKKSTLLLNFHNTNMHNRHCNSVVWMGIKINKVR